MMPPIDKATIWKGRRWGLVWHIYRPERRTRFGVTLVRKQAVVGGRLSFSLRWVIGWVLW